MTSAPESAPLTELPPLGAELTLPEVSQTVIITRMAGRTAVPERESFRSLAAHHSTMAVFLSAGLLEEMEEELKEAGYRPDTPGGHCL